MASRRNGLVRIRLSWLRSDRLALGLTPYTPKRSRFRDRSPFRPRHDAATDRTLTVAITSSLQRDEDRHQPGAAGPAIEGLAERRAEGSGRIGGPHRMTLCRRCRQEIAHVDRAVAGIDLAEDLPGERDREPMGRSFPGVHDDA